MPKLTIDGKEIEVPAGTTIIQAADKLGITIPRYCYHEALPVSGNCRICMVEVEKMPKLQIACYTPVAEGMVVKTTSPKVIDVRKVVLGYLLVNHPLDCPVCDQAGECKLQDYYMEHGQYDSALNDVKVKKEKKAISLGPTVMLDQERCILCTRCVRFTDNISKTHEFGVFDRGDHSQLDLYPGKELNNNYSGNVVDICPVGALTDKDFRFKCRVWYLDKTKSVCPGCSTGCNITVEWDKSRPHRQKKDRVMRLKPRLNPNVNAYWMCDTGRYNYHFIDQNRIVAPQLKNDLISWPQAIDTVVNAVKAVKDPNRIGVIASAQLTNEDLFAVRKLFKDNLKVSNVDFRVPEQPGKSDDFLLKADRNPNTAGASAILAPNDGTTQAIIEKAKKGELDVLYVFGQDLVKLYGKETVAQIRKSTKMFVYQGSNINDTCSYAHLNLPSAVYAEKDGTFTNFQNRVQRISPAFMPLGEAKGDWEILSLLSEKIGPAFPYRKSQDVFKAVTEAVAPFAEMTYEKIADQGLVLRT
ncbi:MAG: molybdopterin-dependent oxidoreductase [Candidatus Omnitrophica bacterium]|nr:molybdopterin-dependent oxidoreductase [Candidatus Omnitrophota bacterium]